jgi:hypothetical protein
MCPRSISNIHHTGPMPPVALMEDRGFAITDPMGVLPEERGKYLFSYSIIHHHFVIHIYLAYIL